MTGDAHVVRILTSSGAAALVVQCARSTAPPARRLTVIRRTRVPWTLLFSLVLAVLPVSLTLLRGQAQAPRGPAVIALKGATLVTVTHGTIPNGTIVIRDGKIADLGANVTIPTGA